MDNFNTLLQGLKTIPDIDNSWDRLIFPFKGSLISSYERSFEDDQKRFLGIPEDEHIVYVRIISADKTVPSSLAITNRGIYHRWINKLFFFTVQDETFNIQFKDINEVKYSEREKAFIFSNGSEIGHHLLVKNLNNSACFKFAEILTKAANSEYGIMDYFNKGISLMKEDKDAAALEEFNKALNEGSKDSDFINSDERAYLYFWKGRCHVALEQNEEAKTNLIIAKEISSKSSDSDVRDLLPAINANLSFVVDSRIESHKLLVEAFNTTTDFDAKKDIMESLNSLHISENFKSDFLSRDRLSERKVVIVLRDNTTPIPGKSLLCLEHSVITSLGMSFPIGHPIDGCAYIAHPARNNYYIPAAMYDEAIFIEKVNEYCYLLQCLGAKDINIQKIAGKSFEEMNESKVNTEASLGHKSFGIDGNADYRSQHNYNSNKTYKFESHMSFNPIGEPYVPEDLNWLAIEPKWKRLIDNRLNGSLSHFIEEISTSEDKLLSDAEEMSVNLEIKNLITRFKGSINTESIGSHSSKQSTTWRIEVDF